MNEIHILYRVAINVCISRSRENIRKIRRFSQMRLNY